MASNVGVWKLIRLASVLVFVNRFRFNGWCLGHHQLPKPESCVEVFMLTLRFGGSSNPTTYLSLGKKEHFYYGTNVYVFVIRLFYECPHLLMSNDL